MASKERFIDRRNKWPDDYKEYIAETQKYIFAVSTIGMYITMNRPTSNEWKELAAEEKRKLIDDQREWNISRDYDRIIKEYLDKSK